MKEAASSRAFCLLLSQLATFVRFREGSSNGGGNSSDHTSLDWPCRTHAANITQTMKKKGLFHGNWPWWRCFPQLERAFLAWLNVTKSTIGRFFSPSAA